VSGSGYIEKALKDLKHEAPKLVAYRRAQERLSVLEVELNGLQGRIEDCQQALEKATREFSEKRTEQRGKKPYTPEWNAVGNEVSEKEKHKNEISATLGALKKRENDLIVERDKLQAIKKPELDALLILRDALS
jgi:hypothetical protein